MKAPRSPWPVVLAPTPLAPKPKVNDAAARPRQLDSTVPEDLGTAESVVKGGQLPPSGGRVGRARAILHVLGGGAPDAR